MFTAGKLIGAIYFAGLAFLLSSMLIPMLPEQLTGGLFTEVNVAAGVIAGWMVMGPRAKGDLRKALGAGLTTSIAMFMLALLTHSGVTMVELALRKRYENGVEAVIGVLEEAWKYFVEVGTTEIIATTLVGGMIGGLFARAAAKNWN